MRFGRPQLRNIDIRPETSLPNVVAGDAWLTRLYEVTFAENAEAKSLRLSISALNLLNPYRYLGKNKRAATAIGKSRMTDSDLKGANATNREKADGRILTPQVRSIRSRRGKRTQRHLGEPVTVQFLDGRSVPATVVDESTSGLAIDVADKSLFRRSQLVNVCRHRVRTRAVIRYVESEADTCRVGLKLVTV